jgi:uncharacterized protein YecA (UPF0149 family)
MGFFESIVNIFRPEDSNMRAKDLGRNDLCWCGSGNKYKKCHLADDEKKMRGKSALQCGKT